jgi:hypothetical protein
MKMLKPSFLRTDPFGTPDCSGVGHEKVPQKLACDILLEKQLRNRFIYPGDSP